jgi:hypothetical protein
MGASTFFSIIDPFRNRQEDLRGHCPMCEEPVWDSACIVDNDDGRIDYECTDCPWSPETNGTRWTEVQD